MSSKTAKKVLIVGGGIAGLATASYLQRNGFSTEIFEMHTLPGGVCTAWTRKGYSFDFCIHWLMGSSPSSNLNHIWKELGAGDLKYIEWDFYTVVELSDKRKVTVYSDPQKLEQELLSIAPEDSVNIKKLCKAIHSVSKFDLPAASDKMKLSEWFRLLLATPKALPVFKNWMGISGKDFLAKFTSPLIKELFTAMYSSMQDMSIGAAFIMMMSFMAKKTNGYPVGGSLNFAKAIEAKLKTLGGVVHYGFKVDEILTSKNPSTGKNEAYGIKGEKGEYFGDYIISASDAFDTVKRLLKGKFTHPQLESAFTSMRRFPSLIYISLGLNHDYSQSPHSVIFPLKAPLTLEEGALTLDSLSVRFFTFDPMSAPKGKTAAIIMIPTENDAYWSNLWQESPEKYNKVKDKTLSQVIDALELRFPGLKGQIEVTDIATPHTIKRYTGNWHGSFEGWLPANFKDNSNFKRTFDDLDNLLFVGQWVNPGGGLPPCGMDGRSIAKKLCKMEGLKFKAD